MRVLVTGSRSFRDHLLMATELTALDTPLSPLSVIHGGASGADTVCSEVCLAHRWPVQVYRANWTVYGRRAGPLRNQQMVDTKPHLVLAFWDGASRGTLDCMNRARMLGLSVKVIEFDI